MKKFVSLCAAALLAASLMLSGCHGRREQAAFAVPETFDTSKNYEVVFWAKNDTNKTQTDIYKQAIADFQQLYPNITVTLRLYTDYGDIYNDVITNISTAPTPNVCITYPDHIATYLTGNNVVVPLDQLFEDDRYGLGGSELRFDGPTEDEIVPQFLEECKLGGTYYAIPYMRSTEACYINKDFVEALGYEVPDVLTWDFCLGSVRGGSRHQGRRRPLQPQRTEGADPVFVQIHRQHDDPDAAPEGGGLLHPDRRNPALQRPPPPDCWKILPPIRPAGHSPPFKISGYPANFLNAGQCVFAVDLHRRFHLDGQRRATDGHCR